LTSVVGAQGFELSLTSYKHVVQQMSSALDEIIMTTDPTQFAKLDGLMKTIQLSFFAQLKPLE